MIRRGIALIRQFWDIQFLRFLVVGGINTVFGYSVFAIFILLKLPYPVAALLGHTCGVLFNFKTYGILVFRNKDKRLIFKFVGVYLFTYSLITGLLWVFNLYGVNNLIAGAIIALPVALVGFILNKRFVFRAPGTKVMQTG
ncbi:GtrA family protein [Chloroflexota bacterium]